MSCSQVDKSDLPTLVGLFAVVQVSLLLKFKNLVKCRAIQSSLSKSKDNNGTKTEPFIVVSVCVGTMVLHQSIVKNNLDLHAIKIISSVKTFEACLE